MKKLFIVLCITCLTVLISCHKSDTKNSSSIFFPALHFDSELNVSCLLTPYPTNGITCFQKTFPSSTLPKQTEGVARYYDKVNKIACYQAAYPNAGLSCIEINI